LNSEDRIVAIASLSRLGKSRDLPLHAVIMAGGLGTRLRPLTDALPKPMLPVGGRPLLQHTVERLRDTGICNIHITTHYKADKITAHFGDGGSYNAAVQYSHEDQPLGTAGALKQIDVRENEPLLVINGDVLTTVNYRAMLEYHREHQAQLTMGIRRYVIKVPYGVVECEGPDVRELREKPEVGFFVNAGIYLVEPRACQEVPDGQRFDMTDLIDLLITRGQRVVSFPIHEYWVDIGQFEDYERAQEDVNAGKL
jgi:NDP-sugar pyrophosphorylase family protein